MQTYTNKVILQSWKCILYKIQLTNNSLPQEQDNKLACSLIKFPPFMNQRRFFRTRMKAGANVRNTYFKSKTSLSK